MLVRKRRERAVSMWKPRDGHVEVGRIPWLARMTDKARAQLRGIGDYIYPCPIDQHLLDELGLSAPEFLEIVRRSETDDDVIAAVNARKRG